MEIGNILSFSADSGKATQDLFGTKVFRKNGLKASKLNLTCPLNQLVKLIVKFKYSFFKVAEETEEKVNISSCSSR